MRGGGAASAGSNERVVRRLEAGAEFVDGGGCYRVVRVEPAPNPQAFRARLDLS
jgi:hypothetical protein